MALERIDHAQLAMPSGGEDRARAFYQDILGLPEQPKPAHLARRGGAWFESSRVKVHLGVDKNFVPARRAHVAFVVSDLKSLTERCRKSAFEVVDDEPLEGFDRIYVFDPFGNRLELMGPWPETESHA